MRGYIGICKDIQGYVGVCRDIQGLQSVFLASGWRTCLLGLGFRMQCIGLFCGW